MMPIYKYRSVEEMSEPRWREPGSSELLRAIKFVWELGRKTSDRRFPPGVYKYRTAEEAQAQRDEWIAASVKSRR